jgi:hypothetical protein
MDRVLSETAEGVTIADARRLTPLDLRDAINMGSPPCVVMLNLHGVFDEVIPPGAALPEGDIIQNSDAVSPANLCNGPTLNAASRVHNTSPDSELRSVGSDHRLIATTAGASDGSSTMKDAASSRKKGANGLVRQWPARLHMRITKYASGFGQYRRRQNQRVRLI